jgi:cytochrome c biogenesis protein CcmG/thiol:disulfide interchange protein DsbE
MKKLIPIIGIAGFLLFAGPALKLSASGQVQAPAFTVTDINGKTISLSQYRGKVLFLNFWATWCPPCRAEIPDFVDVYSQYKTKGLEIIGISLDTKEKSAIVDFVQKFKINYPIIFETKSVTAQLLQDYQPGQFIPTTIVIDKTGRIRQKEVGALDKEKLLKYFNLLIAE